jgi:hypothetical protein
MRVGWIILGSCESKIESASIHPIVNNERRVMTLFTYVERYPKLSGFKPKRLFFLTRLIGWIIKQKHINVILEA